MTNQQNTDQQGNQIAKSVKDTAGAAHWKRLNLLL